MELSDAGPATDPPGGHPAEGRDNRAPIWRRAPAPAPPAAYAPGAVDSGNGNGAAEAVDGLREACLAVEAALDRAAEQLHDATHPLPRLTMESWDEAIDWSWAALASVRAGLAEARTAPNVPPPRIGDVIARLRAARHEADRAANLLAPLRRRLLAAADLARRAETVSAGRAGMDWHRAVFRIDLATARLAIGSVALERYLHNLGDPAAERTAPPWPVVATSGPAVIAGPAAATGAATIAEPADTAAGARTAGAAVLLIHPWRGWRGKLARIWHDYRTDYALLKENVFPWR